MSALHFYSVRYKNLLSSGNTWTEIQLDKNKSTLIVGENGAGKSSMLDAICFALYGKPFRKINKPQLINSINQKNMCVEVKFRTNGKDYTVKRGMKPNIFEIWRETELLNQDAATRDYQTYLEENILKLNYKSFGQIVVLGSSTFVPFMQLPAGQRREVIEDLLDIQIFTHMNSILKEKLLMNKEDLQEVKYQIDLLTDRVKSAKEHNQSIQRLKKNEIDKIKKKVKENLDYIESETTCIEKLESEVSQKFKSIQHKEKAIQKKEECEKLISAFQSKQSRLKKDNDFFEDNDNCPTCRQGIDEIFRKTVIKENSNEIDKFDDALKQLKEKYEHVSSKFNEIKAIENEITSHNLKIQEHRVNIKLTKKTLQSIKNDLTQAEKDVESIDKSKIIELESSLREYKKKQEDLVRHKEVLTVIGTMLKDGGIKTRIIKQYVPVMNKLINKYLAAMDFFVDFRLDEGFNETIKSRFRDVFSYASFSEGEKLRIDLALLFTWRAVSKLRNSVSTNLLIMDEIMDSSLDNSGTEEFLKIINELTDDSNIFIISHKGDQLYDKFEDIIRFKKVKNFSVME